MNATCPVCSAPQDQGLLCHADTTRVEELLRSVPELVDDLDITVSKQARIGVAGTPGLARERTPINVGAMQAADNLTDVLTTWAREVGGVNAHPTPAKPAPVAAAWSLLVSVPEIRRHASVVELVDEITDAINQARRAIDRPADRVYLGRCYAETPDDDGRNVMCLAELYSKPEARDVRCKTCGAEHHVTQRRAWLMQRAADMIVTVKEASTYLGTVGGIKVSQSSIRGYVHRGRLAYRPGVTNGIRLGDLLTVVLDDGQRKGAAA